MDKRSDFVGLVQLITAVNPSTIACMIANGELGQSLCRWRTKAMEALNALVEPGILTKQEEKHEYKYRAYCDKQKRYLIIEKWEGNVKIESTTLDAGHSTDEMQSIVDTLNEMFTGKREEPENEDF